MTRSACIETRYEKFWHLDEGRVFWGLKHFKFTDGKNVALFTRSLRAFGERAAGTVPRVWRVPSDISFKEMGCLCALIRIWEWPEASAGVGP